MNQQSKEEIMERFSPWQEAVVFERTPYYGLVTLTLTMTENALNNQRFQHLAYNGGLVGPTIRVRPGDEIDVRLQNRLLNLPQLEDSAIGATEHGPHGLLSTNLHTHGLHVSPEGESDDTFVRLDPGDDFTFRFVIPKDHPAGTFWYHPHKHGSVAWQLSNGLAGALIVEGGLDWAPELTGVRERIMVFQQFWYQQGADGVRRVYPEDVYASRKADVPPLHSGAPSTRFDVETAINGVVSPLITMRPGEVQRWRMIHAGMNATLKLNLVRQDEAEAPQFHEIAVDGLALGKVVDRAMVELNPGNRSDVLVQIMKPGFYLLRTEVKPEEMGRAFDKRAVPLTYVARIYVDGEPVKMTLPPADAFAGYEPPPIRFPISRQRNLTFNFDRKISSINGREFMPSRIDQFLQLGTAEEWTVAAQEDNHPFHIHVNPFQVFIPGVNGGEWLWRDTLMIPAGETARIRMEFRDFEGRTVLHCHNLMHEDQGMMQRLQLTKDAAGEEQRQLKAAQERTRSGVAAAPWTVPAWQLPDATGQMHSSADLTGRKTILVFHRGAGCTHCSVQLSTFMRSAAAFTALGYQILAVGPGRALGGEKEFAEENNIRFPLLFDADLSLFKAFRLFRPDAPVLHGVFLLDAMGNVCWSTSGENPSDPETVLEAAELLQSGS